MMDVRSQKDHSSPEMTCKQYFKIEDGKNCEDEDIWIYAVTGNCLFSLAFFTSSYFVDSIEINFMAFRLLVIVAHIITSHVAMARSCDSRVVLWTIAFVVVNIYKLLEMAYRNMPAK